MSSYGQIIEGNHFEIINSRLQEAKTLNDSVVVYFEIISRVVHLYPEESLKLSEDLLKLSTKSGFSRGIMFGYISFGRSYVGFSKYNLAEQYFNKAIDLAKQKENTHLLPDAYTNIGWAYYRFSKYNDALKYYNIGIDWSSKLGQWKHEAQMYKRKGLVYFYLHEYKKAIGFYELSLQVNKAHQETDKVSSLYTVIGNTYQVMGDYTKALDNLSSASNLFQPNTLVVERVHNSIYRGHVYLEQDDLQKAEKYYLQAINEMDDKSFPTLSVAVNIGMAKVFIKRNKLEKAEEYALKAYQQGENLKIGQLIYQASSVLVTIYKLKKDFKNTFYYTKAKNKHDDFIIINETNRNIFNEQRKFEIEVLKVKKAHEYTQLLAERKKTWLLGGLIVALITIAVLFWQRIKLKSAFEALEISQQIRSEFLTKMSHEIKTPLNVIMGYTNLLKRTEIVENQVEYLNIIEVSGKKLNEITTQLLEAKYEKKVAKKVKMSAIELDKILAPIIDYYNNHVSDKNISFVAETKDVQVAKIVTNKSMLQQLLVSLIGNAVKFTNSGTVTLAVATTVSEDEAVFKFSIIDTGIGIKDEDKEIIFEQFSQIESVYSEDYDDLGLGLTIAKNIAQSFNSDILVESIYGEGSTFSFEIKSSLVA